MPVDASCFMSNESFIHKKKLDFDRYFLQRLGIQVKMLHFYPSINVFLNLLLDIEAQLHTLLKIYAKLLRSNIFIKFLFNIQKILK